MPLAAAADPHQPAFRVQGREPGHDDVRINEPVGRNLFLHHRKLFGSQAQVPGQRIQQLYPGLAPVAAGLCQLHQISKIVDELPQFFIHSQTLAARSPAPWESCEDMVLTSRKLKDSAGTVLFVSKG